MKLLNKYNLPPRIVRQISTLHKPEPNRISVTSLIGCPRERQLQIDKWVEITLDYSDFLPTLLGISLHERQDRLSEKVDEVESEVKYEDKIGQFTVVGKADNYDTESKIIRETKVKAVGVLGYDSFIEEVERQLNVYAWQRLKRGFQVNGLELDVYYRDWVEWQADKANNTKYAVMKEGRKTALKVFNSHCEADKWMVDNDMADVDGYYIEIREPQGNYPEISIDHSIPVKLWSFADQQQFIEDQVELFTLDDMYCDERCRWRNDLKCKKYCKSRSVCEYALKL
jgi:hypothetical protein